MLSFAMKCVSLPEEEREVRVDKNDGNPANEAKFDKIRGAQVFDFEM